MSATGELFPHQPEIARYYNHRKKKMLRHSRAGKTVDLWAIVAKCSQMVSSPLVMCVEPKKIKAKPEGKHECLRGHTKAQHTTLVRSFYLFSHLQSQNQVVKLRFERSQEWPRLPPRLETALMKSSYPLAFLSKDESDISPWTVIFYQQDWVRGKSWSKLSAWMCT